MSRIKLKDIAVEINERVDNPSQSPYEIFVGLEHYDSGEATIRRYGSTERLESTMKVFHTGDVLVARRNVYLRRAAAVNFDGLTSGDSIVLHIANEQYRRIIPFVLNTDDFWDYANQHADGSMSKRLSPKLLMEYEFSLPDKDLDRVSEILWAMERVKNAYRDLIARTDDLVKSQFIEMFGNPATNSKGLRAEPLSRHITVIGGFAFKSKEFKEADGIPVLRIGNINSGHFIPTKMVYWPYDESLSRYFCRPGDLVISLTGTVGKGDYANICRLGSDYELYYLNQRNAKLILKDSVLPEYVTALLANEEVKALLTGAGQGVRQANISNADISNLIVPIPEKADQQAFARLVEQSDKSKFEAQQTLQELTIAQKALMKKIFE